MRLRAWAFALAVTAALVGSAAAETKVVLGYQPTIDYVPVFVAKEEGFFAKRGLDVSFVVANGANIVSGLVAGSLQIGTPTIPTMLQAVDNGLDLVIIAGGPFLSADQTELGIVVKPGTDATKPQSFVAKKIGVSSIGAFMHVMFADWLARKGVDPKQVSFVEVPFPQMNDVMKRGSIDAALVIDPFMSRMVQDKTGVFSTDFLKDFPSELPASAYVSQRGWATANPEAVRAFRESVAEAMAFMSSNDAKTRADTGKYLKLPPEVLAHVKFSKLKLDVPPASLSDWTKMMQAQGFLKSTPDPARLIAR